MDLWIRSQGRELLIKSPELKYNQKGDYHSILAYDTLGAYRILGKYKTKERALEILDEIQKVLMPSITYTPKVYEDTKPSDDYKHYTCESYIKSIDILETYVYEMPKE